MNRIEEIDQQVGALLVEKKAIQAVCTHPPLVVRYRYKSNTGNYDRHDDCYWTELRCTLCGRRWTADGSITPGIGAKRVTGEEAL